MSGTARSFKDAASARPGVSSRRPGRILAFALLAAALLVPILVILGGELPAPSLEIFALLVLVFGLGLGAGLLPRLRRAARAQATLDARLAAAEAARFRAEEESRAKSRFLAEMSHELRTPLNTVMGFSEMMAEEVLGPHRVVAYKGYARDIHACGSHLLSLADDILDLARIESGHRVLMETAARVDLVARDCLSMMAPEARRRGLALSAEGVPLRLWADERALRQMLLNLVANAVKFTPEGGEVRLSWELCSGAPVIRVEDTGRGIAERELPLEDARHRESRVDLATGRGAGLGLAIVEGLAALHGGSLVLSRRAGGGTRASLALPASRVMAPEPIAAPAGVADAAA